MRNLRLIQEKYNIVDVITPETAFGVIKLKLSSTYYYYNHLGSSSSCIAEFIELLRPVLINLPKSKISDLRTTLNNNFSIWYRDLKAIREKLDEIYSTASENQSVLGSVLDFFNL